MSWFNDKCQDICVGNVQFGLEVLNKHVDYASPIPIIMSYLHWLKNMITQVVVGGWLNSMHMCVSRMLAQEGDPSILVIYSLTNVCKHDVIWKPEWNFTMSSSFGLKLIKATDYILLREWWMTLLTHVANIKRWHNQSLWNIFK